MSFDKLIIPLVVVVVELADGAGETPTAGCFCEVDCEVDDDNDEYVVVVDVDVSDDIVDNLAEEDADWALICRLRLLVFGSMLSTVVLAGSTVTNSIVNKNNKGELINLLQLVDEMRERQSLLL